MITRVGNSNSSSVGFFSPQNQRAGLIAAIAIYAWLWHPNPRSGNGGWRRYDCSVSDANTTRGNVIWLRSAYDEEKWTGSHDSTVANVVQDGVDGGRRARSRSQQTLSFD